MSSSPTSAILIVIITVFLPPLGVFLIRGCGGQLLLNILLTLLGVFPGHIHAFWLEYNYYNRQDRLAASGNYQAGYGQPQGQVPVQQGGYDQGYAGQQYGQVGRN